MRTFLALLGCSASMLATAPAAAQVLTQSNGDQANGLQEIVVTAQKRSESLQRVPIAVTAISGNELRQQNVQNIENLQASVPNLNIGRDNGAARITVRGIGLNNNSASSEGSIAFHLDGVYIQRPLAALTSLYDLERIEVLRGPQGTLYGRNATGGSINVITARPTRQMEGYVRGTVGTYSTLIAEGAISGPLVEDKVLARFSFKSNNHGGFGHNLATGNRIDNLHEQGARGQIQFIPTEKFNVLLSADYSRGDDDSGESHFAGFANPALRVPGLVLGGYLASDPRDIANRLDPVSRRTYWGVHGTATYDISDGMSLKSITAFRRSLFFGNNSGVEPTSLGLFPLLQNERSNQFSQEFQFTGQTDRLEWISGLYYYREKNNALIGGPANLGLFTLTPSTVYVRGFYAGTSLTTQAYAAFGQVKYKFSDTLALTLGARYSSERKSALDQTAFDTRNVAPSSIPNLANLATPTSSCGKDVPSIPVCEPSHRWNSFTPKVSLDYTFANQSLVYANFSKGFKAGTYNLGSVQGRPVDPEKVDAYEVGAKTYLFDRRVRLNLSTFLYDYTDLQVGKILVTQLLLENAATARIKGVELEMNAKITPQLQFNASAGYLDAKFRSYVSADPTRTAGDGVTRDPVTNQPAFNLKGNRLPQAPRFSGRAGFEYRSGVGSSELTLRGDVAHTSRSYFTAFNQNNVSQRETNTFGASISLLMPDHVTRFSLTGTNLTDVTRFTNGHVGPTSTGGNILANLNEPRMVLFSVERSF